MLEVSLKLLAPQSFSSQPSSTGMMDVEGLVSLAVFELTAIFFIEALEQAHLQVPALSL